MDDNDPEDLTYDAMGQPMNRHVMHWGGEAHVCREILNPGFFDPYDPRRDVTLELSASQLCGMNILR